MDDENDDTVIRNRLRAHAAPVDPAQDSSLEDTVLIGAITPSRHAAPPPLVTPPPAPEPKAVYAFRVGARGVIVTLDRAAYIGRRPSRPRIPTWDSPRLVRVPSPSGEVSASHLEVRQRGSSVVVTDLKTTNGSVVRAPGRDPVALARGESLVVAPGTTIDIGDGNIVTILPLQLSM